MPFKKLKPFAKTPFQQLLARLGACERARRAVGRMKAQTFWERCDEVGWMKWIWNRRWRFDRNYFFTNHEDKKLRQRILKLEHYEKFSPTHTPSRIRKIMPDIRPFLPKRLR